MPDAANRSPMLRCRGLRSPPGLAELTGGNNDPESSRPPIHPGLFSMRVEKRLNIALQLRPDRIVLRHDMVDAIVGNEARIG
jgi:hypothetical protein